MPNKLPNNADRYTLVLCKPNEIEAKITACSELGLTWIAGPRGSGMRSRIEFHVFFDNAGKENYMNGFYDESYEDHAEPDEVVWEKEPYGLHFNDQELGEAMVTRSFHIGMSWEWSASTPEDTRHAWGEKVSSEKDAKMQAISFLRLMNELGEDSDELP